MRDKLKEIPKYHQNGCEDKEDDFGPIETRASVHGSGKSKLAYLDCADCKQPDGEWWSRKGPWASTSWTFEQVFLASRERFRHV
jgi:hypothetical protein